MSYRKRHDFLQPSADELIKNRKVMLWLFPLYFLHPGFWFFDDEVSFAARFASTLLWAVMLITILWVVTGVPMRWMSKQDRAKMDDEWNRFATGDACKWGMAGLGAMTIGASFLGLWFPLEPDRVLYAVTNGAVVTALGRLAWLSRDGGDDEDE